MKKIERSKLYKPEIFLLATGKLLYGQEEFIYIKSLSCDNVEQSVTGEYIRLIKTSETSFDIIAPADSGAYFKYRLVNGYPPRDYEGNEIYAFNSERGIMKDDEGQPVSRLKSYDANIEIFGSSLAAVIMLSIKNHLGYHPGIGD